MRAPKNTSPRGTGNHPKNLKSNKGKVWNEEAGVWMFPDDARMAGVETDSERIAGEVEDGLREIGGKKKPGYEKAKADLLRKQRENLKYPYLHKGD